MESKKQSKTLKVGTRQCGYCGGQCSNPYAIVANNTLIGFCNKACLQAHEADRLNVIMEEKILFMKEERWYGFSEYPIVARFYSIQVVFIRALLKGTKTKQLEQLKDIMMERCVEMMDRSSEICDSLYKDMSDGTKLIIDNFDFWIKVFGR